MVKFMLYIFYHILEQPEEEEKVGERKEVYLFPQSIQGIVTTTTAAMLTLIILEAGKSKIKSPAAFVSCKELLPGF